MFECPVCDITKLRYPRRSARVVLQHIFRGLEVRFSMMEDKLGQVRKIIGSVSSPRVQVGH